MTKSKVFDGWSEREALKGSAVVVVLAPKASIDRIIESVASKIGQHYVTEKLLKKWGRSKIAEYLANKMPVGKKGRSGDVGEILATEFVNSGRLPYRVPINRLRWKDTRNLAMRGEDLIGFDFTARPLKFLKAEAKSRKTLSKTVVSQARQTLQKNGGLPLSHTLSFIMERLYEANEDKLAERIEEYVIRRLPKSSQVAHLIFTFSGNDPEQLLKDDARNAKKPITHYSVGAKVSKHQEFIQQVFEKAASGRVT